MHAAKPVAWEPLLSAVKLTAAATVAACCCSVAEVVNRNVPKLNPLLNQTLDGWMYDPNGTTCAPRCLTFSLGAPFGASAAAAAGSKVDQGSEGAQRWLWAYYYRNMEGHHLHTVGLEVQLDVAGAWFNWHASACFLHSATFLISPPGTVWCSMSVALSLYKDM